MASSSGKKYGLITHQSKKTPVLLPKLAAFGDSSDEEESAHSAVNQSLQYEAQKQKVKKQTQLEIQRALEEDPTVYEYDSIYDSMEQKKQEKARAMKATKDSKDKLPTGTNRASWKLDKIEILLKILLISHDKYVKAKSSSRVGTFYAEMGEMLGQSGMKVENLMKNLGREYRDMVWQMEESDAQGFPAPARLRGSQKLFCLFQEFARMYGMLKEKRNRPAQSPQGATDVAAIPYTEDSKSDIQLEMVTDDAGFSLHPPLEETPSGSNADAPYPVRFHTEDFLGEHPTPQNARAVSKSSVSHPATSSTMADIDTNPFKATRKKRKFPQSVRPSMYPGLVRKRGRPRTIPRFTSGRKRKRQEDDTDNPTCSSRKRTCSCQDKTSKFEEQLLSVLSGIGRELQLLRRGFFTVYNIGEEPDQEAEENLLSDEEDLEDDYDDDDDEDGVGDRHSSTLPNVVFP
ncbi:nuclear speckle splicing regulatory protein 1-like isoform X1 [Patiria miniata]|uniref:Nuclear speckle splicing regulatory protein 1 N-terminal domain-containing protein n=1 Tax=Patiria miniata TaxID=46514 RepID=A0A914A713_PATMI|nr:nuclear speckle splicing regulatory protein 1-like isoform X1 [Patiria miniata]